MIVKVVTLGCKVNQVESAEIIDALNGETRLGVNASAGLGPADVYVLNTCSVTAEADRKSRQQIAKMQKFRRTAASSSSDAARKTVRKSSTNTALLPSAARRIRPNLCSKRSAIFVQEAKVLYLIEYFTHKKTIKAAKITQKHALLSKFRTVAIDFALIA